MVLTPKTGGFSRLVGLGKGSCLFICLFCLFRKSYILQKEGFVLRIFLILIDVVCSVP